MELRLGRCASPLGPLLLVSLDAGALCALEFADGEDRLHRLLHRYHGAHSLRPGAAPSVALAALAAYFDGALAALSEIHVHLPGTPFRRSVWTALQRIPPGEPTTYGALAAQLGRPAASRAVGHANGANPIGIVIPCHRLVGAAGALTGYGGGLPRKRWLLDHEQRFSSSQTARLAPRQSL